MKRPSDAVPGSCRRRVDRYMLADGWLEWRAEGGALRRSQVLDASLHGICFGLDAETTPPSEGTEIDGVVLSVNGTNIRGRLIVVQWTDSIARGVTCGAEFHPTSFDDAQKYQGVIDGLERCFRSRKVDENE